MNTALWIIAICEIIRAAQNFLQIAITERDAASRGNVYSEFIQSLKHDDSEFVRRLLEEYERHENDGK